MLEGKVVLLGVTGSIAAYKIANLASLLVKQHAEVHVIMTQNAQNFINPITFESITKNKCLTDTFDRMFTFEIEHVSLAEKADICMIAPASANIIGKLAGGIADDMLSTTAMACRCKRVIAPAMNTAMFESPAVSDNLEKLRGYGWEIAGPDSGRLACGAVGRGKMISEMVLFDIICRELAHEKDLKGKNVLVTAGATIETIDPVRYITNRSTGKMGCAIARAAMLRGASVTLVHGHMETEPPPFVRAVPVSSAKDMFNAVTKLADEQHIIIKAAAVADYTPAQTAEQKIKKTDGSMTIALKRTRDILQYLGDHKKEGQYICGFSMETENLYENSYKKLLKKNADMIAANSLTVDGAGFGTDTNILTLITRSGTQELPKLSKLDAAHRIFDMILNSGDFH